MPLIVQPDGTVAEGAIPPGGVAVLVLDNGEVKEAFVEQGTGGGGGTAGEVTRELLQYDNRNTAKRAAEKASVAVSAAELSRMAAESVTAAVLGQALEVNKRAVEDINASVTATANEVGQRATDTTSVVGRVLELNRKASDTTEAIIIPQTDVAKRAVETTPLLVMARALETGRRQVEQIESAIVVIDEPAQRAAEQAEIVVSLTGYANAVVANTTWANPNNALGNTTGTAATLTATASGLAGTTNNTATGSITLGFQDVNLGDLTISNVDLFVENQGATAGVAIAQPTTNIQYQYSLDGTTFTTLFTHNTPALPKGIRTVDITALVGQDQAKLSALQIRATGSVTSGTGLGASNTASFFRAWLVVNAARTYT
jgi:hypothetical protein